MPSATEPARLPAQRVAPPRDRVWHVAALLLTLLAVEAPRWFDARAASKGYLDFDAAYYPAAQLIRHDPAQLYRGAAYDPGSGRLTITAAANFVNLPLVAWLFVPFTAFAAAQAGTILLAINIGCALASLGLVQGRLAGAGPVRRWALTAAFMTSGPLLNALNLGQITPWVLVLLLLGESALHRGRDGTAGVWLGLACLLKIPPLLFLPYLALRRRWRVVGFAGGVLGAALALSLACYGWDLHATYFDLVFRANAGTVIAAHNSQSIASVLGRAFTDASLWSWQPVAAGRGLRLGQWGSSALLLALCVAVCWRVRAGSSYRRTLLELGAVLCLSLLLPPLSWVHYGSWLLPVFAVVATVIDGPSSRRRNLAALLLGLAIVLVNFPVPPPEVVQRWDAALWFRVAISHQCIGTVLLLALCLWAIQRPTEETEMRKQA